MLQKGYISIKYLKLNLRNLLYITSLALGVVYSHMIISAFAQRYLLSETENYRGSTGKLISVQPQKISALSPVVVDFGGSQSGNRCMVIFTVGACWTGHGSERALSKIQQKVHGRLISRRCEMMPEINSYSACVRYINHLDTFGIWAKRGNQLLV